MKSLFKPSSKIPENRAEVFMFALSDGDALGVWLALSPAFVRWTAPVVVGSLITLANPRFFSSCF